MRENSQDESGPNVICVDQTKGGKDALQTQMQDLKKKVREKNQRYRSVHIDGSELVTKT